MLVLFQVSSVYAQTYTLEDYVLEHRGDTLVIKDDADMGEANTVYNCLLADSQDVPAGRVYMLRTMGYYGFTNSPTTSSTRKVIIVGEDSQLFKTSTNADFPPIVSGDVPLEGDPTSGGMTVGYDLEVKNLDIEIGNANGDIGWSWFGFQGADQRLTLDNCIMEHTWWIFISPGTNSKIYVRNNYFVNMTGYACRRNGGVIDCQTDVDTILVENNTHIWAQGMSYKSRNNTINKAIFNHNTFINCSNLMFMNAGYLSNLSLTNNMFINCNLQPYAGDINRDADECDQGNLPTGLVNVMSLDSTGYDPDSIFIYVDKNLVYWDPKFDDMVSEFNSTAAGGYTNWSDQKITMNSRTQSMFDDNTYSKLREYGWIKDHALPSFTDPANLFTDQLDVMYNYTKGQADDNSTEILPMWRLVNDADEYFTYADWPIPVDLSYSDADLLTAGLGGFPVGDLNWFPTQFATWSAQSDKEYTDINNATMGITAVNPVNVNPSKFELKQNYPNPFNPNTEISFTLPNSGNVTLKVYNTLGEQVASLVNGYKEANTYKINFNASSLPSGVYIYTINYDNASISKKMMLLK
jgi:hypothetical protein